jgi:hypothetical protein
MDSAISSDSNKTAVSLGGGRVRKFTGITISSRHMAQVVYATSLKLAFYSTPKRTSLFGGGIHIHNDYPLIFHNLTSLPDDTG